VFLNEINYAKFCIAAPTVHMGGMSAVETHRNGRLISILGHAPYDDSSFICNRLRAKILLHQ